MIPISSINHLSRSFQHVCNSRLFANTVCIRPLHLLRAANKQPHDLSKRRVWVTGASSGIGRAVALELANHKCQLILSSRNAQVLDTVASEISQKTSTLIPLVLPFDVTDKAAYGEVAQKIKETGGVDIVFLNAGVLKFFDAQHFKSAVFEEVMSTNFFGMVRCIEVALPLLRQSQAPHIVGMSSLASYGGLPRGHATYGASKAAIRNMLEGLRLDLLKERIPVTVICPGFIKTKLSDQNDFYMPARISAEEAAKIIVKGIKRKDYEIHFPKRVSIPSKILSILPSGFQEWLMDKLFKLK